MNDVKKHYKRALTIAGSDPSGGAGIQADLKTFAACGCYGASAIVAVVDENTVGVTGVHPVPVDFVVGQIRSVLDDIGADAVKIGMLHSSELIRAVRDTLSGYDIRNVVLDPVMVATSGDPLLEQQAIDTLRDELVPHVRVITPNIPEAEILLGRRIADQRELPEAARALSCGGRVSVLLKAGHLHDEELVDIFYDAESDCIVPSARAGWRHPTRTARDARSHRPSRPIWRRDCRSSRRRPGPKSTSPRRSPPEPLTRSATATAPCTTSSGSGSDCPATHRPRTGTTVRTDIGADRRHSEVRGCEERLRRRCCRPFFAKVRINPYL